MARRSHPARLNSVATALLLLFLAPHMGFSEGQVSELMESRSGLGGTITASWAGGDPCGVSEGGGGSPWPGLGCSETSPPSITSLNLLASTVSGSIPSAIFQLHNLTYLNLGGNPQVSGTIPDLFDFLPSLEYLDMHGCALSGQVPQSLSHLTNLTFLALNNNQLSGSLPADLGNAQRLTWLDINTNNISGPIPESLSKCTNMAHLHLSYNQLSSLPTNMTVLQDLVHILLDHNNFSQPFLTGFTTCMRLENIRLSGNNWMVEDIVEIMPPHLKELYASRAFASPVPVPDLARIPSLLDNLQILELNGNRMFGTIPEAYSRLSALYTLNLRDNSLGGPAPVFQSSVLTNLQLLDLQRNDILQVPLSLISQPQGNFTTFLAGNPVCQGSSATFCQYSTSFLEWKNQTFDELCPKLECPSGGGFLPNPAVFTDLRVCVCSSPLRVLMKLNSPAFTFFSPNIGLELRRLVFRALSDAGLENANQVVVESVEQREREEIPFYVKLLVFPASADALLDTQKIRSILSADKLFLGLPFGLQYSKQFVEPEPLPEPPQGVSKTALAGIVVGSVLFVLLVAGIAALVVWQRWKHDRRVSEDGWSEADRAAYEAIDAPGITPFTLSQLSLATKDFSTLVGAGAFGQVYLGVLSSGEKVAVKRPKVRQSGEALRNEIELSCGLRHRNLVSLVGYCCEQGEQLLVYEFVAEGTVADWLHGSRSKPGLSWAQRLAIAEGAARGLAYLHCRINPPIVHRDIKPANILLSESLEAKVADFGVSKIMPDELDTVQGVGTRIAGTVGYLDPEYRVSGFLTVKSDVYSFGIVLLQLATGHKAVEKQKHIRNWVKETASQHGIMHVMDPALAPDSPPPREYEALVRLGMQASLDQAKRRPFMQDIVESIVRIRGLHSGGTVLQHAGITPLLMPAGSSVWDENASFMTSEADLTANTQISFTIDEGTEDFGLEAPPHR